MRRLITAAGASAMLLLAAACAQQGNDDAQKPAGNGAGLSTSANAPGAGAAAEGAGKQKAPEGGTQVAANQVDAAALPADYPRQVWTLRDGRTVAAYGQKGGCSTVRLEVESQSQQQVRLRFVEKKPDANQLCTMQLEQEPVTAGLQEPLGDRDLVLDLKQV